MTEPHASTAPAVDSPVRATPGVAILVSVVLVELSSGITQGFLSPVLRSLTEALNVTAADLNWISIANLLASVAFTPVLSRMGDLYGHRRILRWNLAIVLAGSLLVGTAQSFGVLLAGQVLQGAFAGFFPLLVGILRNRSGAAESRRGIGIMVAALIGGVGVGMVASGLVAHYVAAPTAALWVPAVAVSLALIITWPLLPESDHRPGGHLDLRGGLLLSVGLVAILLGLGQGGMPGWEWTSTRTIGCLAGGMLVIALWIWVELRSAAPMIDVRLFRHRNVTVVSLVAITFSFCQLGLQVTNAIFLGTPREQFGYGLGLAPLTIAFAMLPGMATVALTALFAPALAERIGDRATLVLGSLIMAVGYLGNLAFHNSLPMFLLVSIVAAVGAGLLQQSTRSLAVESVPHDQAAVGSGINELFINIGGSLGAACALSFTAAATIAGSPLPTFSAYGAIWTTAAVVSLAGAGIGMLLRRNSIHAKS
ncbi:MFS transporter [Rhodococcus sp. WS3]|uniref:MFS transporter n=1 Tax=Rhodococcus sp. WS3 TaxID=2486271 RepID=UPI001142DFF6|nr:MFS transporter [Rhodococcus sp. WS3]ROZ50326.1 MFS transporter [Rhodococcus sp. WS3]